MKNIHVFKTELPSSSVLLNAISSGEFLFTECGESDFSKFGFASEYAVVNLTNGYRIDFLYEEKILPLPAIRREINRRAQKIEGETGEHLSKKQLVELKEIVIHELVKKALTKITGFSAYYHEKTKNLIVDVSSPDLSQKAISVICHALESVKTTTLHVSGISNSLSENILECISSSKELGFAGFSYGDKLHLSNDEGETVQFKCDYTLDHVAELLTSGYKVKRVRLSRDGVSFDITDTFKIKSIASSFEIDEQEMDKQELEITEQQLMLEIMSANCDALVDFFDKSDELKQAA